MNDTTPATRSAGIQAAAQRHTFALARYVFLRALGIALMGAFVSLWCQGPALIGPRGLTPVADTMAQYGAYLDAWSKWRMPTLFWLDTSDEFIRALAGAGIASSMLLTAGVLPRAMCAACYVLFLSFASIDRFAGPLDLRWFNWPGDNLMTEATFLAIFLAPAGWFPRPGHESPVGPIVRYLLYWLTFRLFFGPGIAKVINDDPTWLEFTALKPFYETLPSPTCAAATVFDAPMGVHMVCTFLTLTLEVVGALLFFVPGRARRVAAALGICMMGMVQLCGNFRGLAIMSIGLLALLFDDQWLLRFVPRRWFARLRHAAAPAAATAWRWTAAPAVAAVALAGAVTLAYQVKIDLAARVPGLASIVHVVRTFGAANSYAMFAAVQKDRPGLVVQGSNDGEAWLDYEPLGTPSGPRSVPRRLSPYSDYLGFALWVISPLPPELAPSWLLALQQRLLLGDRQVAGLFATNPFPDQPPRLVRVVRCQFRFAPQAERRTGVWWRREWRDVFVPGRALDGDATVPKRSVPQLR